MADEREVVLESAQPGSLLHGEHLLQLIVEESAAPGLVNFIVTVGAALRNGAPPRGPARAPAAAAVVHGWSARIRPHAIHGHS
jgi:hypothetical protein